MSSKKLKPEVKQLHLTKYVKANNNNNIAVQEDPNSLSNIQLTMSPSALSSNTTKRRKNPCEGISPKDKISPPMKKTTTGTIMSEEEYTKMECKLHTNLTASLTSSLTETVTESLKGNKHGMIDNSRTSAIETLNNAHTKMMESSRAMNAHDYVAIVEVTA